ncbi:MAG: GNAT family N-acetyltransferase [Pseudomonadota bacterium]
MGWFTRCPGEIRRLDGDDWPVLLRHVRRLPAEMTYDRFARDMSDEDLVHWAKATAYTEVLGIVDGGELRASVEIGYRGDRAECAITVEPGLRRYGVGRRLFRLACDRARAQGARSMAMLTKSRGFVDLRAMAARPGWSVSRCYARSIIIPSAEPEHPLWLIRDLSRPAGLWGWLSRLWPARTAEQD